MVREESERWINAIAEMYPNDPDAALVTFRYPALYKFTCNLDVKYFPFDKQICTMVFGSWTYDATGIDFFPEKELVAKEDFSESEEWQLISFKVSEWKYFFEEKETFVKKKIAGFWVAENAKIFLNLKKLKIWKYFENSKKFKNSKDPKVPIKKLKMQDRLNLKKNYFFTGIPKFGKICMLPGTIFTLTTTFGHSTETAALYHKFVNIKNFLIWNCDFCCLE